MSVTEIKQALMTLSPDELADIAAFVAQCDAAAWDRQIEVDFAEGGRFCSVLEDVRKDLRQARVARSFAHRGRLKVLPATPELAERRRESWVEWTRMTEIREGAVATSSARVSAVRHPPPPK